MGTTGLWFPTYKEVTFFFLTRKSDLKQQQGHVLGPCEGQGNQRGFAGFGKQAERMEHKKQGKSLCHILEGKDV